MTAERRTPIMRRLTLLSLAAAVGLLLAACGNMAATPTAPQAEYAFPSGPVMPTHDPFVDVAGGAPLAEFPTVWFVEIDALPRIDGGSIGTQSAMASAAQTAPPKKNGRSSRTLLASPRTGRLPPTKKLEGELGYPSRPRRRVPLARG